MNIEEIKHAITSLPEDERHSLAEWLNALNANEYDAWDKQMVEDFSAGAAHRLGSRE